MSAQSLPLQKRLSKNRREHEAARKRPEEFQKRLNSFIEKTRRNKLIMGYGGIEKYYR